MTDQPQMLKLEPHGFVPNNPRFPALLYRRVLDPATPDLAAAFETLFEYNHWPPAWRNGVYDFHHYHSNAHEALAFAGGSARLTLGGPGGIDIDVRAGDVAVLPAGTGHRRIGASADFLVVGAYPPETDYDLVRSSASPDMLARIAALPSPGVDPVAGEQGALVRLWR